MVRGAGRFWNLDLQAARENISNSSSITINQHAHINSLNSTSLSVVCRGSRRTSCGREMSTSSPSWLKETALRFEDIARHHAPPITVYLPALLENGVLETLPPENYDLSQTTSNDAVLASDYQWKYLAKDSGIYTRRNRYFPRVLLWRTVSGGTLTTHCVDSVRPKSFPRNRPLPAIHFRFPVQIRPNCIGFSESESNIILYVLTEECVLYLIHLSERVLSGEDRRPDQINIIAHRPLFLQASFGQGKLALELPHFMQVLDDAEIIFAMQDGKIYKYDPIGTASISN
jgi:hypothetical protein